MGVIWIANEESSPIFVPVLCSVFLDYIINISFWQNDFWIDFFLPIPGFKGVRRNKASIRSYPNIIWATDKDGRSLFHIAVINRQESVFNLLYETVAVKETILTYVMKGKNENVMHLAGYLAPLNRLNIISRAALQMQRELLWFKVGVSMYYFSFLFLCMFTLTNLHLQNCRG